MWRGDSGQPGDFAGRDGQSQCSDGAQVGGGNYHLSQLQGSDRLTFDDVYVF